ncbi:hypothetical protein [Actinomadura sp. 6N118]|uniref:hypothetical protein n=1 Tax=Actinomadura sp. 6N118 TaxID=3375151 RepID=UPI0037B78C97
MRLDHVAGFTLISVPVPGLVMVFASHFGTARKVVIRKSAQSQAGVCQGLAASANAAAHDPTAEGAPEATATFTRSLKSLPVTSRRSIALAPAADPC